MTGHGAALRRLEGDLGELLARHEKARDLREFSAYADEPVAFASEVLKVRLWPAQQEMLEALRDHRQAAILGGQGVGKDFAGAVGSLWWCFAHGGLVLATAATQRQAVEVVHAEIVRLFRSAPDLPGEAFRSALRVPGAGGVLSFVSTESSKATGFHHERVLGLASEAQALEPWAFEALRACAVGPDDRLLCLANPLVCSGPLYRAANSGRWEVVRVPATEHPNVLEGRSVIPGGPSREWIAEMAADYGESSSTYRSRVLAEWPESEERGMFRRSWLEAAAERWPSWREKHATDPPTIAVDPARYGPDATVCAVVRGPVVEELVSWHRADLMESVAKVRALEERLAGGPEQPGTEVGWYTKRGHWRTARRPRIRVDEVGVGSGLLDRLRQLGLAGRGFNGGCRATDSHRFTNLRAESYWSLRDRLAAGEIALPPDERLFAELLATTWAPTANGKVQVLAKDEIRSKLGRSPDRADAVMMALAAVSKGLRRRVRFV